MKRWPRQLPQGERERELLRRRARRVAGEEEISQERNRELLLEVVVGGGHYGIPYRVLAEVMRPRELTPVPSIPVMVAGVIPRRGDLITVLDLGRIMDGSPCNRERETRVVVVQAVGLCLGILVDEVAGNLLYVSEALTPPLKGRYVNGIHDGRVAVLDIDGLLTDMRRQLERDE